MARIYIASSWRNGLQPALVKKLRDAGHKVYDFHKPCGKKERNVWESVTRIHNLQENYRDGTLRPDDFDTLLSDRTANDRFDDHFKTMGDADTCVMLLPCGSSAHVEAGYMAGAGKRVFVMDYSPAVRPELMYLVFDGYFHHEEDLLAALEKPIPGVCRVCGCTETNACYHPDHGTCDWVDDSNTLCSHCASKEEGGFGIADDPRTDHCVNDFSKAFK